ncbi:MAG: Gfo/Idh/MocA family oxidoreductase [Phycisphaeraceae bacterium]|nr:Gfo/Idh/MocA family oxidoreductase [Phycisphaeraceae bacterium]
MALVGCGGMAKSHAQRFAAVKGRVSIAAVVDTDLSRALAVAKHLDQPQVSTDYKTVLDGVDAVLLVLPHHLHHVVAKTCMEAGKHVLLEKPMANSESECLDLIATAKRMKRTLMIAYPMRYHPMVVKFKQLLDEKAYGQVFQVSIWTEQFTRYPADHWASSASTLGGGQLFSHGCHYIDLLLWMLGRPTQGCHVGTNFGTPWMELEGTSHIYLKFESGALGYHFGTWGARGTKLRYAIHAHCTGGMLEADFATGQIVLYRDRGTDVLPTECEIDHREFDAGKSTRTVLHDFGTGKHTDKEILHFVDCIEQGRQPDTNGESALAGLRVIWKLYEAERAGVVADLHELDGKPRRKGVVPAPVGAGTTNENLRI